MEKRNKEVQASVDAYETMMVHRLARFIHERLEYHALKGGWETPPDCKVIFDNLPGNYKGTLLRVATDIMEKINSPMPEGELDFRLVD